MRSPEHEREIEARKASAFRTTLVTFRGESEHSNLPSVVRTLFLSVLVPGMTTIGYVQPERLMQHQEPFVANSLLWYWWGFPWPKSIISLVHLNCRALSRCRPDMSIPWLLFFLFLQSLFTLAETSQRDCSEYTMSSTFMKADIILGAFIPIYITIELFKETKVFFESKPDLLFNITT